MSRLDRRLVLTAARPGGQSAEGPVKSLGNFSHIVANLDRSLAFYRDGLGLEVSGPAAVFRPDEVIMKLANVPGAQTRYTWLKVPGSAMAVELIEYKGIERQPVQPRFQDPGATNLTVRVRDLDGTIARLKTAGGRVITVSGTPAEIGGRSRIVFMQDPDGFVIELSQSIAPPPATAETPGNVLGAGFELTIDDTDKTVAFYRDFFGMRPTVGESFNADKLMADTAGTPGAQFRQSRAQVPDTSDAIRFIEVRGIDRKPPSTRLGTLHGDAAHGARHGHTADEAKGRRLQVVTTGGAPLDFGPLRIAVVRDPNNLFSADSAPPTVNFPAWSGV
jgi:catechol 2,3-dioxygenase-like lactoylglutathione lyase family enzyme